MEIVTRTTTNWRLTLILGGDYKKNKNKIEVNLDT